MATFLCQAQLTATLFPTRGARSNTVSHHQPCNTPMARTPSNSISMGGMSIDMTMSMRPSANSRRGSYSTPYHNNHFHPNSRSDMPLSPAPSAYHHYVHTSSFDDTVEEDERMVEELLLPPPNSALCIPPSTTPFFHESSTLPSSNTSSFTTSDPFYLSQLQASQQPFAPNPATAHSFFAQNGRMTPGSQFALQAAF